MRIYEKKSENDNSIYVKEQKNCIITFLVQIQNIKKFELLLRELCLLKCLVIFNISAKNRMKQRIVDDFSEFFLNPNEKNICKSKKTGMTLLKHKKYSFNINSFV